MKYKDFETLKSQYEKYENVLFRGKVSNVNEYLNASDVYLSTILFLRLQKRIP